MSRDRFVQRLFVVLMVAATAGPMLAQRTVTADVVALDQAFYNNRLGSFQAGGMIFALRGDVVSNNGSAQLTAGNVMLRPDKRPRPMVLRMNLGDCIKINFQNLLAPGPSTGVVTPATPYEQANSKTTPEPGASGDPLSQPATRLAGVHAMGLELKELAADGSWTGANPSSLVAPGGTTVYQACAAAEGTFLLYSTGADVGLSNGFGGQLSQGLFGAMIVQPRHAEWYRSQVTREDLDFATYRANALPANMSLAPKMTGANQTTFTAPNGKTYKVWTLTTGSGPSAVKTDVTEVNRAGDPVDQSGFVKTTDFHPIVNYKAVYPPGSKFAGLPVLSMMDSKNQICHSDLTAIITGPNAGRFPKSPDPTFTPNPTYPERSEPYREFVIHYHDDFVATQAFPPFQALNDSASYALEAARDFFAINYGMGAIGPEVWANRINVGPMAHCDTCKFEEFFLSSWAVADPAMVVDVPANLSNPAKGIVATKALYPDDPSNVYHSYMGDHTYFRILHAGTNITHVHHQHAHQWLHSPDSDDSDYRDSQMISPGGAYTLDMSYFGAGNLNQTVGDSIFHCHFYPHFAQGMWSLWRVHDVFEPGTTLDQYGKPAPDWNRALPDGEITAGTPIPALVPMPTIAMAPMPVRTKVCPVFGSTDYVEYTGDTCPAGPAGATPVGYKALISKADLNSPTVKDKSPGFPFYVPGVAGQRAPHPPLDFAPDEDDNGVQKVVNGQPQYLDGGLPRNQPLKEFGKDCQKSNTLVDCAYEHHNAWDFSKDNYSLLTVQIPEDGTSVEKVAMKTHATRLHPSITPSGQPANFILNGQSPKHGAPYADPAIDIFGHAIKDSDCSKHEAGCKIYKAANIQMDVVLNKKGWHYPQQRMISLWGDVKDNLEGNRRPEPMFFRANSEQVVEYWHANLAPNYYDLDDFQVRTPTDILGQHIHLVKFDVTASDGAGNGFNYEDGTLSNQEVEHLIHNINTNGGMVAPDGTTRVQLAPKEIPYFAKLYPGRWLGAQVTIQRWYADPIFDCRKPFQAGKAPMPCAPGQDRTLRTVFTHDHFGPSTHQQVGLYAGLVIEPKDSKWFNSTTGEQLGGRFDGGPTTFQANIIQSDSSKSYREFLLEFQDRQLAYLNTSISKAKKYEPYLQPKVVNPGFWGWADPNNAINRPNTPDPSLIPGGPPFPHLVTNQFQEGAYSLNYANEPLIYRVNGGSGNQADLGYVFKSMTRADAALNVQPAKGTPIDPAQPSGFKFAPPFPGAEPTDPYTPLLRAYQGDNIQIRNLVGAHMGPHAFHIHGLKWQFEPSLSDSGLRSTQGMGLSEHYELLFHLPVTKAPARADYLYIATGDSSGLQYGNWGLLRGYKEKQPDLIPLADSQAKAFPNSKPIPPAGAAPATCPANAPKRDYQITAVFARDVLDGALVYNSRGVAGQPGIAQIADWNALIYVLNSDLDAKGKLKANVPREPLVLRAAAGECVTVELSNKLKTVAMNAGVSAQPPWADFTMTTSQQVGLHAQLVSFDVTQSDGVNIGSNPDATIAPGAPPAKYAWYAGKVEISNGQPVYTPMEFGAISLTPADPLMQHNFGLIGALVIEPQGSTWTTDDNSRAMATVTKKDKTSFREGVIVVQDDLAALRTSNQTKLNGDGTVPPTEPAPGGFSRGLNYRTEPLPYRYTDPNYLANDPALSPTGIGRAVSNSLVMSDPQTPVIPAEAGKPLRLRMVHPAGLNEQVFELHGHVWQEEPYSHGSVEITDNNPLSQWMGSRDIFGPNASFDVVLKSAGGSSAVKGDYLYRTFMGTDFLNGMWGVVRVGADGKDAVTLTTFCAPPAVTPFTVAGVNTVNMSNHHMAKTVTISGPGIPSTTVNVDPMTGTWSFTSASITTMPASVTVTSTQGGTATANAAMCPILQLQHPTATPIRKNAEPIDRFKPEPKKEGPVTEGTKSQR
jgi:manganese oxidase